MPIREMIQRVLREMPPHVTIVAAAKTRSVDEVRRAIAAGVRVVGHNYVQEAQEQIEALAGDRGETRFEMIGHLQRNKVRDAVRLFDRIQTVDSLRLAEKIDAEAAAFHRIMPILVEVNSGREPQKAGAFPEDVPELIDSLSRLRSIRVEGLMTMGPAVGNPEELRPVFRETRALFDEIRRLGPKTVRMETLSMGMSDSYRVAIDEGSTMVRLGTVLFGPRAT